MMRDLFSFMKAPGRHRRNTTFMVSHVAATILTGVLSFDFRCDKKLSDMRYFRHGGTLATDAATAAHALYFHASRGHGAADE